MNEDRVLRDLRRQLIVEFPVRPGLYWLDAGVSAAVAWIAFAGIVLAPAGWMVLFGPLAVVGLLRAAYFTHDIAHVGHLVPGFELAWNAAVGCWIGLPSFLAGSHDDHHRPSVYGTTHDPEYDDVASWSRGQIVASVAMTAAVPALLVVRFVALAPLSWAWPALRRRVWARASSLQTNLAYTRRIGAPNSFRVVAGELGTLAVIAGVATGIAIGALPSTIAWAWYGVTASALAINQVRTLVAHGYSVTGPRSLADQVADSRTAHGGGWLTRLVYPAGTRFHALHHLAPTLPYHALGAATRRARALANLPSLAAGDHAGILDGLGALWNRARRAPALTPRTS